MSDAETHPFSPGDRVLMWDMIHRAGRPGAAEFAATVTGLGTCDDCGLPTIHYLDPVSGEPDEAHAMEFELMERGGDLSDAAAYLTPAGHHPTMAIAMAQLAEVHARLAQTPQPVTVAADPDAGLADMLTAASVAGSGDGQAILAGRRHAWPACVCGHRQEQHTRDLTRECVATWRGEDNLLTVCTCAFYEPVGSEPGGEE